MKGPSEGETGKLQSGWTLYPDVPKVHILRSQPTQCITLGMLLSLTEHKNSHPLKNQET